MIVWIPTALGCLICMRFLFFFFFCICTCSAQLSMFRMEKRSRNTLIIIIIINCLRNHLSLVGNIDIAHFSVFYGQKHDFLTPPYCFNIEIFNI